MIDKWFISDTHFFHEKTWKVFQKKDGTPLRPYSSTEEMNEDMIQKWNSCVKHGDKVYHLGDVTFEYGKTFRELMSRLNGQKTLILGNHDKIKGTCLMDYFQKIELWKGFHFKGEEKLNFTCSHIPLMLESLRDGYYCVHGHEHDKLREDPHYINVCVEVTAFTPVHMDEILEIIRAR